MSNLLSRMVGPRGNATPGKISITNWLMPSQVRSSFEQKLLDRIVRFREMFLPYVSGKPEITSGWVFDQTLEVSLFAYWFCSWRGSHIDERFRTRVAPSAKRIICYRNHCPLGIYRLWGRSCCNTVNMPRSLCMLLMNLCLLINHYGLEFN